MAGVIPADGISFAASGKGRTGTGFFTFVFTFFTIFLPEKHSGNPGLTEFTMDIRIINRGISTFGFELIRIKEMISFIIRHHEKFIPFLAALIGSLPDPRNRIPGDAKNTRNFPVA